MGGRLSAYLALTRAQNSFTVMADVLAGVLIAGGGKDVKSILLLLAASACICAAGSVLSDIFDLKKDAAERPARPLASGALSLAEARILTAALFLFGLGFAYAASSRSFTAALVLSAFVISYNTVAREIPIAGPLNMGACRAMHLMLGMASGAVYPHLFMLPLITLAYGSSTAVIGRFEAGAATDKRATIIAGWGAVMAALILMSAFDLLKSGAYIFLLLFAAATGPAVFKAFRDISPERERSAAAALMLAFPILNAIYASGAHGFMHGLPVALLALPALLLPRRLQLS